MLALQNAAEPHLEVLYMCLLGVIANGWGWMMDIGCMCKLPSDLTHNRWLNSVLRAEGLVHTTAAAAVWCLPVAKL